MRPPVHRSRGPKAGGKSAGNGGGTWEGTHLGRNVVLEVTCILRGIQLRMVWWRVFMDVLPVDTPKPRVHLVITHSVQPLPGIVLERTLIM